jgi:hypothetical protein
MQVYIVLQESLLEVKLNHATWTTHKLTHKRFDKKRPNKTFSRNACTCDCAIGTTSKLTCEKLWPKNDQAKPSLEMCVHMIMLQELHKITCKNFDKKKRLGTSFLKNVHTHDCATGATHKFTCTSFVGKKKSGKSLSKNAQTQKMIYTFAKNKCIIKFLKNISFNLYLGCDVSSPSTLHVS